MEKTDYQIYQSTERVERAMGYIKDAFNFLNAAHDMLKPVYCEDGACQHLAKYTVEGQLLCAEHFPENLLKQRIEEEEKLKAEVLAKAEANKPTDPNQIPDLIKPEDVKGGKKLLDPVVKQEKA